MLEMSIRQFVLLSGGKLTLSETPPLAGEHEPISRIVPVQPSYEAGDVVFTDGESSQCLEAVLLQGAMGVVATRSFAPLASCFSVCVPDTRQALRRVAEYCRDRYLGRLVVMIVPADEGQDLCWQLINIDQASSLATVKLSADRASQLKWCDAHEVVIDGRLSENQRNFVVTYSPTNAPIRLAG